MKKSSTLEHELIQLINIYMHEVCNNFVCKSRSLTLQYMKLNSYIVKFSTFQGENNRVQIDAQNKTGINLALIVILHHH